MTMVEYLFVNRRRPRCNSTMRLSYQQLCYKFMVATVILSTLLCIKLQHTSGFSSYAPIRSSVCPSTSSVQFPTTSTTTTTTTTRERHNRHVNSRHSSTTTKTSFTRSNTIMPTQRSSSSSALNVWWFGGTEQSEIDNNSNGDSCELVAVRIERTSSNSRKIAGEITIPAPLEAVWSILTDYNRLAIHVPNLMESRVVRENNNNLNSFRSRPGDGSYKCRLYQVGAQKIIGFDFSASVTMDMTERLLTNSAEAPARRIEFKCVDSQFFSEFDGAWTVQEKRNPTTGEIETLCSYVVDVRPKGPVPVAALEWRIREDVPANLRAVKAATVAMAESATATKLATTTTRPAVPLTATVDSTTIPSSTSRNRRTSNRSFPVRVTKRSLNSSDRERNQPVRTPARLAPVLMDWDADETMAKYL